MNDYTEYNILKWVIEVFHKRHPDFRVSKLEKFLPKGLGLKIFQQGNEIQSWPGGSSGYFFTFEIIGEPPEDFNMQDILYKMFHSWPKRYIRITNSHSDLIPPSMQDKVYDVPRFWNILLSDIPEGCINLLENEELFSE
jgi:hypothetical protein